MLGLAAVAAVGGGGAYYYYTTTLVDESSAPVIEEKKEDLPPAAVVEEEGKKEEVPPPAAEEKGKEGTPVVEEPVSPAPEEAAAPAPAQKEEQQPATQEELKDDGNPTTNIVVDGGNRVLGIIAPPADALRAEPPKPASHPVDGHKVTLESTMMKPKKEEDKNTTTMDVQDNIKELQQGIDQESSQTIKMAHTALSDTLDTSIFQDLDILSQTQLKARIVQLATEMKERTKWEAVRLKEFLAMKEKETAEKYLDVLQKQRIEFENIMAQKMREQEAIMEKATRNALEQQELVSGKQLETALMEQEMKLEELLNAAVVEKETQVTETMDTQYSEIMEEYKKKMIEQMTERNQTLDQLGKQIATLQSALEESQTYQSGSVKAHRVSAAALALAEKLETNQGAGPELEALQMSVGDDSVIAAALSSIPVSSVKAGIPTHAELRTRFSEVIQTQCRQAAFVPDGMMGVEGQLLGKLFAAMTIPPSPEDLLPPKDDSNSKLSDYYLVRAREHIELGQLERAMRELNKLKGQAAFTIQSWKKDATDRAAIEKALKVIRMEAALLNEECSK